MFSAAFCAMIFVWMLAIKTLQIYYLPLRYMDSVITSAIETAKTAAANATIIDLIPDSNLRSLYQIATEFLEKENDLTQLDMLQEMHYWFQIVEGIDLYKISFYAEKLYCLISNYFNPFKIQNIKSKIKIVFINGKT